jgi:hypothetical protein
VRGNQFGDRVATIEPMRIDLDTQPGKLFEIRAALRDLLFL